MIFINEDSLSEDSDAPTMNSENLMKDYVDQSIDKIIRETTIAKNQEMGGADYSFVFHAHS